RLATHATIRDVGAGVEALVGLGVAVVVFAIALLAHRIGLGLTRRRAHHAAGRALFALTRAAAARHADARIDHRVDVLVDLAVAIVVQLVADRVAVARLDATVLAAVARVTVAVVVADVAALVAAVVVDDAAAARASVERVLDHADLAAAPAVERVGLDIDIA